MEKKPWIVKKILKKHKDGTLRETLSDWRWIFRYTKKYRRYVFIQTALGIIGSTLALASAVISKYTVDIVTQRRTDSLAFLVVFMVVSALLGLLFSSLQSRISTRISLRVFNDIRAEVFEKLLDGDWQKVRAYQTGDIMNRLNNDTQRIASISISWIPTAIVTFYSFVSSFIAMLFYNASIALIALLGAPFFAAVSSALLKKSRRFNKLMFEKQSAVMSFESETFHNYDTAKSLGALSSYSRLFGIKQDEHKNAALDANMFTIRSRAFLSAIGYLISFATFGYCLVLLWADKITYGTMTFFITQRSKVTNGFNSMLSLLPEMVQSAVSAKRVREFFDIPSEEHTLTQGELSELLKPPVTVRLDSVDFCYEKGSTVIKGGCFHAHSGEVIALVGASGQGKTTLLRLLLGLVSPQGGSAEFIDASGKAHTLAADHRKLFSYVPQGNTVISGTVRENLLLTNENATDRQMLDALDCALALDFVQRMGGLGARIGEKGHGISEGQAQRLAIARAVLRDAPILLFDEATSSLDADTEKAIIDRVIRKDPNKLCIISTHRSSVLALCDRVYRISDGEMSLVDRGEIEKLLRSEQRRKTQ